MTEVVFNPALILIFGALLPLCVPDGLRRLLLPGLPLLALCALLWLPEGTHGHFTLFDLELTLLRVDGLSRPFALIFCIAAGLVGLYGLYERRPLRECAILLYAGAAIGAVLAGDLMSLFIYWELTAISSVVLLWLRPSAHAIEVGLRYLIVQVGSGVLLLGGVALHLHGGGSITFGHIGLDAPGGLLILLAIGIKAAFPLLHSWLIDAYPQADAVGTVALSALTTKLAIYALARGFAGTDLLLPIGAIMAIVPVFLALLEDDLRRVLCWGLIVQLGMMVMGVGIGSEMALNGVAAHAVCHILYKALLFMSLGAVLVRTGTTQASKLGWMVSSMPLTALLCLVGALAASAFPLFAPFVSKSLLMAAAGKAHEAWIWSAMFIASAGVIFHSGLRIPWLVFVAPARVERSGRPSEAPAAMLWAMGLAALLCVLFGLWPSLLYSILPFSVKYSVYTLDHLILQFQLLLFALVAFVLSVRSGWLPDTANARVRDSDQLLRAVGRSSWWALCTFSCGLYALTSRVLRALSQPLVRFIDRHHGLEGHLATTWPTGSMVLWVTILLAACLLLDYLP